MPEAQPTLLSLTKTDVGTENVLDQDVPVILSEKS